MLKLISPKRGEKILGRYDPWIKEVSGRYRLPAGIIRAVMFKEMTEIDLMDVLADLAVWSGLLSRKDSSTGYMQIFGKVGLNAVNFASDRGLADYDMLGLSSDHRLDPEDPSDVRMVWMKLKKDPRANIEIAALNLLSCAEEMTGRIDFGHYTDEELKLILTRYNANVKKVTRYGEETFAYYRRDMG